MENDLVEYLNSMMNEKLRDFSDSLVGKVSQELLFSDEIAQYV